MTMRPARAIAFAILAVLAGVACGDEESPDDGLTPATTLPGNMVGIAGGLPGELVEYAVHGFSFAGSNLGFAPDAPGGASAMERHLMARATGLLPAGASPFLVSSPTCVPDKVGDGIDTDADGVPDDMTITFTAANCTVTDTATGSVQVQRGTVRYRDTSSDLYGFDITITGLRADYYDATTLSWGRQFLTAHETTRMQDDRGDWSIDVDGFVQSGTLDTTTFFQKAIFDLQASFDPNGTITAGGPPPDGEITIAGHMDLTMKPGRYKFTLFAPGPLRYEGTSCHNVDQGTIEMRLNGSTSEGTRTDWIGCEDYIYEFLGSGVL